MNHTDSLKKLMNIVVLLYKTFLGVLTAVIVSIVAANVFSRYVLNHSLGWADELARFLFIWIVFYGAVVAYANNEHIGLDFIVQRLSKKARAVVLLLAEIGVFIVLALLAYNGLIVSQSAINLSPALYIRMGVIYSAIPVSAGLMTIIAAYKILQRGSDLMESFKEPQKDGSR